MNWKKVLSGLLLAFVLVTVGFALGKEVTLRRLQGQGAGTAAADSVPSRQILVYYLHGTVRCKTCNAIEAAAHEAVETHFATELRDGRVVWRTANFQEREDLARRYEVTFSTVVVSDMRGAEEAEYERLDDVWTYKDDPAALRQYVADAVRRHVTAGGVVP